MDMMYWVFRKDQELGSLAHPGTGPITDAEAAQAVGRELERTTGIPHFVLGATVFYYAEIKH